MNLNYKTHLFRYGFDIKIDFDKRFSGFYWEALSADNREVGRVDNYLLQNKRKFFIETSFSPEKVNIYPVYAVSKTISIEPSLILPGQWKLKFINLSETFSTIQIFGAKQSSYEGFLLVPSISLSESRTMEFEFFTSSVLDKLFVKKDNYSSDQIIISDFSLARGNEILISDQSLIKPEHENIVRKSNRIVFKENSPIWSFFTIMFHKP